MKFGSRLIDWPLLASTAMMVPDEGEGATDDKTGTEDAEGAEKTPAAGEDGEAVAPADGKDGKPVKPWAERRIGTLTYEREEAKRRESAAVQEVNRLREENAQLKKPKPAEGAEPEVKSGDKDTDKRLTQAEIDRQATEKAQAIVARQNFDAACEEVFVEGSAKYDDFDTSLGTFKMLGGLTPQLLDSVFAMDEPHEALYQLSKDPELAEEVMKMTPARQAIAIHKMLAKAAKDPEGAKDGKKPSDAPEPKKPINGGKRTADGFSDDMTMDQFSKEFDKKVLKIA